MSKNNGGPAFPVTGIMYDTVLGGQLAHGITARDYFAAKAMQGLLSGGGLGFMNMHPSYYDTIDGAARSAYAVADAMLAERENEQ